MKDRSDDPSHYERTLLPRSYISLPARNDFSSQISINGSLTILLWPQDEFLIDNDKIRTNDVTTASSFKISIKSTDISEVILLENDLLLYQTKRGGGGGGGEG